MYSDVLLQINSDCNQQPRYDRLQKISAHSTEIAIDIRNTVLNTSFATLHICLIFGSLYFANHCRVIIGKNTNYLHKQSNIFGKNYVDSLLFY